MSTSRQTTEPIRVLIVDDHAVVRIGLRTLLSHSVGFRVVGEAGSVAEALTHVAQHEPHVVLLDVRLPDGSGVEACRKIKHDHPDVRVVMLTSYSDEEAIVGSVMAGASGYLLKHADGERLTQAIREAASGAALDPRAAGTLLTQFREMSAKQAESELSGLTDRERRMLDAHRGGLHQPRDRRGTAPLGEDRPQPCEPAPAQARLPAPLAGGGLGRPAPTGAAPGVGRLRLDLRGRHRGRSISFSDLSDNLSLSLALCAGTFAPVTRAPSRGI